jgi:hypothetical protein
LYLFSLWSMRAPIPIFKTKSFLNFKEYVTNYIFFRNFKRDTLGTISIVLCNPIFRIWSIWCLSILIWAAHVSTLLKFYYACRSFSFILCDHKYLS